MDSTFIKKPIITKPKKTDAAKKLQVFGKGVKLTPKSPNSDTPFKNVKNFDDKRIAEISKTLELILSDSQKEEDALQAISAFFGTVTASARNPQEEVVLKIINKTKIKSSDLISDLLKQGKFQLLHFFVSQFDKPQDLQKFLEANYPDKRTNLTILSKKIMTDCSQILYDKMSKKPNDRNSGLNSEPTDPESMWNLAKTIVSLKRLGVKTFGQAGDQQAHWFLVNIKRLSSAKKRSEKPDKEDAVIHRIAGYLAQHFPDLKDQPKLATKDMDDSSPLKDMPPLRVKKPEDDLYKNMPHLVRRAKKPQLTVKQHQENGPKKEEKEPLLPTLKKQTKDAPQSRVQTFKTESENQHPQISYQQKNPTFAAGQKTANTTKPATSTKPSLVLSPLPALIPRKNGVGAVASSLLQQQLLQELGLGKNR